MWVLETMTETNRILPTHARRIVFLVYEGFEILDLAGPSSVFSATNMVAEQSVYDIVVVSLQGGQIQSGAGPIVQTLATKSLQPAHEDTLFVVGAEQAALDRAVANDMLKAWLMASVPAVARFGSFCMGSFILAQAGLLDERSAVTHWAAIPVLAEKFPNISLKEEALYVQDRRVWTSAGVTTGIDMALAMVGEDLGSEIMGKVAQRLVVHAHRPGNQSQFSKILETQMAAGDAFPEVIAWSAAHMHEPIKVADMAAEAGMSERNFYRKFTTKTGITPSKYLEQIRLERARQLLEAGLPLKTIAPAVGFRSETGLRTAFQNHYGISPSAYRRSTQP